LQLLLYIFIDAHVHTSTIHQHIYPGAPDFFFTDPVEPRIPKVNRIDQLNFSIYKSHIVSSYHFKITEFTISQNCFNTAIGGEKNTSIPLLFPAFDFNF